MINHISTAIGIALIYGPIAWLALMSISGASTTFVVRLTAAAVRPRRRAAAEKLPASALRTNDSRLLSSFIRMRFKFYLKLILRFE